MSTPPPQHSPAQVDATRVVGQRFAQGVLDYVLVLVPFSILYLGSIVRSVAASSTSSDYGAMGSLVSLLNTLVCPPPECGSCTRGGRTSTTARR